VKIAIVSDIHGNLAALKAFPEAGYDQLWCLGDLVDYGPRPREVIQWVQKNAAVAVRGNHDHAVGLDVDPQCSPAFSGLADVTRKYTLAIVSESEREFLRKLSIHREFEVGKANIYCVHATPSDPLFGYCAENSDRWQQEVDRIAADVLVVGHTHTPFIRRIGRTLIVNPGSLGQPKTGRSLACYAVYEDGNFSLKEYEYPIQETEQDIRNMPISPQDQEALIAVLHTGTPSPSADARPSHDTSPRFMDIGKGAK
jgi:protein phosphatase